MIFLLIKKIKKQILLIHYIYTHVHTFKNISTIGKKMAITQPLTFFPILHHTVILQQCNVDDSTIKCNLLPIILKSMIDSAPVMLKHKNGERQEMEMFFTMSDNQVDAFLHDSKNIRNMTCKTLNGLAKRLNLNLDQMPQSKQKQKGWLIDLFERKYY